MLIMLVNALSYGTIIPLLYPYSARFGIGPMGLSLLFASFSIAQFLATPIIGRLSDKFGRKPLLLFSLFGTALSLAFFAAATSLWMLFLARILDGITGGNMSVAQAVVADETTGEERAKGFGMLGASFGFGFLVGPALGGLLSEISLTAPFWFASALAFLGTVLGFMFLKETLPPGERQSSQKPLFDFHTLVVSLFTPVTGIIFFIGFLTSIAHNAWIIGFQSFTVDNLQMSATQVGLIFSLAGLINIIMQAVGIRVLLEKIQSKKHILTYSLIATTAVVAISVFSTTALLFTISTLLYMIVFSPQMAMVSALLSERTKAEDQGGMLGLNQAYMSLGQIIGPLIAGLVAGYSIQYVFVATALIFFIATISSRFLFTPVKEKFDL